MEVDRNSASLPHDSVTSGESTLEDLLAHYAGLLNDGKTVKREQILDDHPELGSEILKALEIFSDMNGGKEELRPLGTLGNYKLLRQIGRGGMGVVYEAWENSMDRRVAL